MLYDPKWEKQTETEPSLGRLIAWIERQDQSASYVYENCGGACLVHRYLISEGVPEGRWGDYYLTVQGWKGREYPRNGVFVAGERPHTFGAALKRARAVRDYLARNPW